LNYEANNRNYIAKGISEAVLSRLANAVRSNKFIGNKPLSINEIIEQGLGSGARVVRMSYWRLKAA